LILLDVMLPDAHGAQICQRLKTDPELAHTQIALLSSAMTKTDQQAAGLDAGADDYIARPISNRELLARVKALLRRRQDESDLRAAKLELENILGHLPDGVVVVDLEGKITYANPAAQDILAIRRDVIMQRYYNERTWQQVDERGAPYPADQLPLAIALRERRAVGKLEHGIVALDGQVKWLSVSAAPLMDENGRLYGATATFREITTLREAEQTLARLTSVVEASRDAIIGITLDGVITSWNRGAQVMYGYTAEQIMGQPITRLTPPERAHEAAHILQRIRQGEQIEQTETVRVAQDGRQLNVSLTVSPVYDAQGTVASAWSVARDISERKQAEAQAALQQARETISLERISSAHQTSVTAHTLGVGPLRTSRPNVFQDLAQSYGQVMEAALTERVYKVQCDLPASLRALAERMGALRAGPRDVIDLHTVTLKAKAAESAPYKAQAYAEEGRLLVLELMGHLTSVYRNQSLGAPAFPARPAARSGSGGEQ
jgi:PAS domain S-box-containing protein